MKVYTIHGNAQSSEIFEKVQFENVEHIDLPGHGKSERLENYSIDIYSKYVSDKITEPCVLLGHSLGGHIAINVAHTNPHVKALVITGTPPLSNETFTDAFLPVPSFGILYQEEENLDMLIDFVDKQTEDDSLKKLLIEMYSLQDPRSRSSMQESLAKGVSNEIEILTNISIPFYITFGGREKIANVEYTKKLGLGNVKLFDCAHNVMWELPYEYSMFVKNVISELE